MNYETNLFVKPNEQRQSREDLSDAMARKGRMKSNFLPRRGKFLPRLGIFLPRHLPPSTIKHHVLVQYCPYNNLVLVQMWLEYLDKPI